MSEQTFIIAGASLAGAKAAEELRKQGFDGRVVLIGAEPERPYERPPLDPAASTVGLGDGGQLGFDRLLLSTGSEPRRIPIAGADLDGVHYLRSLSDCDALRERLEAAGHVVVVGAGWIGSEFAASARQCGLEVTVIDPVELPNERIFGPEVAGFYRDVHARHGVELLLGEGVGSFEGNGAIARVRTAGGRTVDCDFAVVGIGVLPRAQLARDAGPEVDMEFSSTTGCRPRRRRCSPQATSPTPGTRSTSSGSELSTGQTR
jgi:3-phenylpropionate/trans-cinnamate dioxygenase ferredoxin reductase component